ncbi:MAG: DMT family transporter [Pseudomonadota bacterium]
MAWHSRNGTGSEDTDEGGQGARQRGLLAYALLLFMGLAWGLAVALLKLASASGGHPIGLAFWQVCVSGSVMLVLSLRFFGPSWPRPSVLLFSGVCGAVGVTLPAVALFWAAIHLPAGIVALAFAVMPLFTYLLSVCFRVDEGDRRRFFGVAVGLSAMLLVLLPESSLPAPGLIPWVLLTFAASFSMALENFIAGGFRPKRISSVQLSCGRQLGSVFLLAPAVWLTGTGLPLAEPWGTLQWAATGTGLLSAAAFTVLLYVIKTSGPIFASQTAYIITLAGVAWGMLLFGERHSFYIWAALALTLLSIFLVRPTNRQQ